MTNEQLLYIKDIETEIADLQKENVFDEETLLKIISEVKGTTIEGFKEEIQVGKGEFTELKIAANELIAAINNSVKSNLTSVINQQSLNNPESANAELERLKNIVKNAEKNETVINALLDFEQALNIFLGRMVIITIMDSNGSLWLHSEKSMREIYQKSGKITKRSRVNFTSNTSLLFNEKKSIQINKNNLLEKRYDNLYKVYNTLQERYTVTKKKSNQWVYYHNAGKSKRWYLKLTNKGVLNEAYASALFNTQENDGHFKIDIPGHDEPGIPYYYAKYIMAVDNRAGAVLGDLSNGILGNIQLAIKTAGTASSGSFNPLIETAYWIKDLTELTPEELEQFFLEQEASSSSTFQNNALISLKSAFGKDNKDILNNVAEFITAIRTAQLNGD